MSGSGLSHVASHSSTEPSYRQSLSHAGKTRQPRRCQSITEITLSLTQRSESTRAGIICVPVSCRSHPLSEHVLREIRSAESFRYKLSRAPPTLPKSRISKPSARVCKRTRSVQAVRCAPSYSTCRDTATPCQKHKKPLS